MCYDMLVTSCNIHIDSLLQIYDLPSPAFLQKSIEELQIGTYSNIATVGIHHGTNEYNYGFKYCLDLWQFELKRIMKFFMSLQTRRDTPLIRALNLFLDRRISALPVVDNEGRAVDIYAKFDVIVSGKLNSYNAHFYRPQTKFAKVMFLHMSVILSMGGWYPSMHCRWYLSMPCSRSLGGACIPACLAGLQAHTQRGS